MAALLGPVKYQVFLGDAWTNPATIEMAPLPQIQLALQATAPSYAADAPQSISATSAQCLTVLEGSQIQVRVTCHNGKPLESVVAVLRTREQTVRMRLKPTDAQRLAWHVGPGAAAPLRDLQDTLFVRIKARDRDGLGPSDQPEGEVHIRADRAPEVAVASIHRLVLPQSKCRFSYRLGDDFAIARARVRVQIERAITLGTLPDEATRAETYWMDLPDLALPISARQLPHNGRCRVDLQPWNLHQGDRLKIVLEVSDQRGDAAAAVTLSKPLYWEVSDQAGVLSSILEADRRMEEELDKMVERQLGLGD